MLQNDLIDSLDKVEMYSFFREKVSEIGSENFFDIYDFNSLHEYFIQKRPYDEYKMFVCLMENNFNEFIYSVKDKKEILTYVLENNSMYYSLFAYSNIESLKIFLNELHVNKKLDNCNYSFLTVLPYEVVKEYINTTDNIDDVVLLVNYNHSIKKTFFLEDSRVLPLINSGKVPISHILDSDLKVSQDILNSNILFEALKSTNMVDMRRNFNILLANNPSFTLEEKLNTYEDKLIRSFDIDNHILGPYKNLMEEDYYQMIGNKKDKFLFGSGDIKLFDNITFDEYLRILSQKKLLDLIIDRLFKDNYYNVIINIKEMLRYIEKTGFSLIEDEYLELYKKIIDFQNLSCKEQIEIYTKYKDVNLNTKFYEDIRKCKDASYIKMINELYLPKEKNLEMTNKYDVDIYLLDGEEFSMIIRGLNSPYRESTNLYRECFSLINQDNTSRVSAGYFYGYNNIDHKNIIHVSENDAFSADDKDSTRKINRIMTSDEINSYRGISEIQIRTDDIALRPNYIVVFNEIRDEYIYEAKRLGIPIVLINEQKYNKRHLDKSNLFSDENNYVRNSNDEQDYIRTHK